MAKQTKGILHVGTGTIAGVTGYERQGIEIIQRPAKEKGSDIGPALQAQGSKVRLLHEVIDEIWPQILTLLASTTGLPIPSKDDVFKQVLHSFDPSKPWLFPPFLIASEGKRSDQEVVIEPNESVQSTTIRMFNMSQFALKYNVNGRSARILNGSGTLLSLVTSTSFIYNWANNMGTTGTPIGSWSVRFMGFYRGATTNLVYAYFIGRRRY